MSIKTYDHIVYKKLVSVTLWDGIKRLSHEKNIVEITERTAAGLVRTIPKVFLSTIDQNK